MSSLGILLSGLPLEVVQNEIVRRIRKLGMMIVRHVLLGHKLRIRFEENKDMYRHGLKFFLWCHENLEFDIFFLRVGRYGDIDIMQHVIEGAITSHNGHSLMYGAVRNGSLELVMYAHDHGCSWDYSTFDVAAQHAPLDTIKYLHYNKCPRNEDICSLAAANGRLEILIWMRDVGYEIDEITCANAAGGGSLECLKWLRSVGCPWDSKACLFAVVHNQLECLEWLTAEGCEMCEKPCVVASKNGSLEVLIWLHARGYSLDLSSVVAAVHDGHLDIVKYLHAAGCELNSNVFLAAIYCDHPHIVKWMHETFATDRNPWPWNVDCSIAALYHSWNCSKYLLELGYPCVGIVQDSGSNIRSKILQFIQDHIHDVE